MCTNDKRYLDVAVMNHAKVVTERDAARAWARRLLRERNDWRTQAVETDKDFFRLCMVSSMNEIKLEDALATTAAAVTDAAKARDEAERELREALAELGAVRERNEALEELVDRIPNVVSYVTATLASATDDPDADWGKVHRGRAFSSIGQLRGLAKRAYEIVSEEATNDR